MLFFDEIADWWDEQRRESEEVLSEFVTGSDSWFRIVTATFFHTAMTLGSGLVDLLRLGEGVKRGGWRGIAEDGLRVLTLAGPVVRGVRGLSRFLAPNPFPYHDICGYVSATQALRQTGVNLFATLDDLVRASGGQAPGPVFMHQIEMMLKQLGARTKAVPSATSMADIVRLARKNPNAVIMFGVRFQSGGVEAAHAIYAFRDVLGRIRFVDRTGRVMNSVEELEKIYKHLPGIGKGVAQGDAVIVYQAKVARLITGTSAIALEVRPAIDATREEIDAAIDAIRARFGLPPSKVRLSGPPAPRRPPNGAAGGAAGAKQGARPGGKPGHPANPTKQAGNGGGAPRSGARTHTVKLGETWMSIAMRYATPGGVSASSIAGLLREQSMMAGYTQPWEGPKAGTVLTIPN